MTYVRAYITWVAIIFFTLLGSGMQIGEKVISTYSILIAHSLIDSRPALDATMGKCKLTKYLWIHCFLSGDRTAHWLLFHQAYEHPANTSTKHHIMSISLPPASDHPMFYVAIYAIVGLVALLGETLASAVLVLGAYRASRILFQRLLYSVTHATMRWHDTTPTGLDIPPISTSNTFSSFFWLTLLTWFRAYSEPILEGFWNHRHSNCHFFLKYAHCHYDHAPFIYYNSDHSAHFCDSRSTYCVYSKISSKTFININDDPNHFLVYSS